MEEKNESREKEHDKRLNEIIRKLTIITEEFNEFTGIGFVAKEFLPELKKLRLGE